MHIRRFTTAALVAPLLMACDDTPAGRLTAPDPSPRLAELAVPAAAPIWAKRIEGTTISGSKYALLYPNAKWNGRLVLIVHGLVDPARPIALPATTAGVDTLGANGNAVAFSSFSENGWAVKDGGERTRELPGLFAAQFGSPARVYLYGQSMGSLIAIQLAEAYPKEYDGVLAECGILGGTFARMRYMFDVRSLFDYFYPGVLPGGTLAVPEKLDLMKQIRLPARAAMMNNLEPARILASFVQTPVPFKGDVELVASIEDQLFRHAREVNDIIKRGGGEPPVGNRHVHYRGLLDKETLEAVNRAVPRYDAGRLARDYGARYYEPSGRLRVPVVTLYTLRDPALPAVMSEELYEERVEDAGHAKNLRRLAAAKVEFGHCSGELSDRQAAFQSLMTWVESSKHSRGESDDDSPDDSRDEAGHASRTR